MFGQILTGMGLLAGGKESIILHPHGVPCLIEWANGWGVVVRSNSNGLLIAHPFGWLELDPKDIEEQNPDGLNVILWIVRYKS